MGGKEYSNKRKKALPELSEKARRFRWEFLRRNPWFREESKRIIEDAKTVLKMSRKNLKALYKAQDKALDATMDFCKKWGLAYARGDKYPSAQKGYNRLNTEEKALVLNSPTNPSAATMARIIDKYITAGCVPLSAFRGIRTICGTILDPRNPKGVWVKMSPSMVRLKPGRGVSEVALRLYAKKYSDRLEAILKEVKSQYASEFCDYPVKDLVNHVRLEIDMNVPKRQILREVGEIIDSVHRLRQDRNLPILTRPSYEKYDDMLKAFDIMTSRSNMTFHDLYRKCKNLPKDAEVSDDQANAIRKVYVRAREIVRRDFRNLR